MARLEGARDAWAAGLLACGGVLAALWFNPANTALTAREFFFDRLLTAHPRSGPDNGVRLIDIGPGS
ncbi:MAG: hypothetical protein FJX29_04595, partial [Alphaproteobacteria bacterium]|nr:hypothetical protein [Alphaproteobacteria bacterium]